MNDLKIFSGTANQALAKRITDYLGGPLGDIALGKFPDGEISCKINEDIRGRDVFLIQPTCPPVNENIMQLLGMIDSALRAGANRVLTMDLHAAQIQGFFDVPVDHLYAAPVLNEHFLHSDIDLSNAVI